MKMYKYKCRILRHDEIAKKCIQYIHMNMKSDIILYYMYNRLLKEGQIDRERKRERENVGSVVGSDSLCVHRSLFHATIARGWLIFVYIRRYCMCAKTAVCKKQNHRNSSIICAYRCCCICNLLWQPCQFMGGDRLQQRNVN